MKDIAIYGFGGFGREVACVIKAINDIIPTWNMLGFFDDGYEKGQKNSYGVILGGIDDLNSWNKSLSIVLAIASPSVLQNLSNKIVNQNIDFPNLVAPNVLFFDRSSLEIGHGNIITFGTRISCGVKIGNFNILNGSISVGHDVALGSYNVLQPETRISGQSIIGNSNFFGVRSLVLQCLKIGDDTRIGTQSVVMRNTKDGNVYFGNPAKILKNL